MSLVRYAFFALVTLASCEKGTAPAAPMVPASELPPGRSVDAGDAGDASMDVFDASDAADDDDDASDADRAACANAAHSLKMPTMQDCVATCTKLPAKPPRGCMTREACKRRCYGTFGPM